MDRFTRLEVFYGTEEEVSAIEEIVFSLSYFLKPGEYSFDIVMRIQPNIARVRKIFAIGV